nr:hypothetical protein [uncultured Carboxylicivirga sp.]
MKTHFKYFKIQKFTALIFILLFVVSCGPGEYKKIPLNKIDPELKSTGSAMVKDILTSLNHKEGAQYLLDKDYVTPLVHGRIMHNLEMYNESYQMVSMAIGKVSSYSLFEVLDKGLIKSMRYKLESDAKNMKFIELKVDVNDELGLADYYLYLTTNDGFLKRENVLPKAVK